MSCKSPANLRPLLQKAGREIASPPALEGHSLYPPALREVLQSDAYYVALVPRGEWERIRESHGGPFPDVAPAALLPLSLKELVTRVCEFVRDSGASPQRTVVRFGDIRVDFTRMEVTRSSGQAILLTTQQFKALKCFLLNPERVFSRAELLNEAWGYEDYPSTRTVDNHVLKLRQKLERDPARPVHFRTVRSVGYKFVP